MKKPKEDLDDVIDILTHQVRQAFENGLRLRVRKSDDPPVIDYCWSYSDQEEVPVFTVYLFQQD